MKKRKLIENLRNEVYVRIMPSPIAGVGVFAIRDIPKGVNPFGEYKMNFVKISLDEIRNDPLIPPPVKKYVQDMCVIEDGCIYLPSCGINNIHLDFFFNCSAAPNVQYGDDDYFITTRKVRAGEELTVNYETYNDSTGF